MVVPDSLDIVELMMAIEEAMDFDPRLTPGEREDLLRDIERRIARGEFPDDLDDDALAALVRKLGPRSPRGQAGAAVRPDAQE